jgi:hypothetical protein
MMTHREAMTPRQRVMTDIATANLRAKQPKINFDMVSDVEGVRYDKERCVWHAKRKRKGKGYDFQKTFGSKGQAESYVAGYDKGLEVAGKGAV